MNTLCPLFSLQPAPLKNGVSSILVSLVRLVVQNVVSLFLSYYSNIKIHSFKIHSFTH